MQRRYTAVRDTPDSRDHIANPAPSPYLPQAISLAAWLPAVRDQGNEGACTMFAGSGILEWLFKRFKGQDIVFSPQFGYRAERILEGDVDQDGGAQSRTMMKVLAQYGLCLESSDPYNDRGWKAPTTAAQLAEARSYRVGAYHRVPDLATLKSVLASGYVASLAIEVYESFESEEVANTGTVPVPDPRNEALQGGHEVYCFGYDDARGVLLCRNSWGAEWGDVGNFTLPYAFWAYVSDSWTCHFGAPWGTAVAATPAAAEAKQSLFFFGGDELRRRLDTIERTTNRILERNIAMTKTMQDVDDQLTIVEQKLSKFGTDLSQGLADLKASIPGVDGTPEFNRLLAIAASIDTADAAVVAADPGPVGGAPSTT